jgi:hypothetical protein
MEASAEYDQNITVRPLIFSLQSIEKMPIAIIQPEHP